jgi:hypothetical protein
MTDGSAVGIEAGTDGKLPSAPVQRRLGSEATSEDGSSVGTPPRRREFWRLAASSGRGVSRLTWVLNSFGIEVEDWLQDD